MGSAETILWNFEELGELSELDSILIIICFCRCYSYTIDTNVTYVTTDILKRLSA